VTVITKGNPTLATTSSPSSNPQDQKFIIHKDFICYYSPFFSAAFNGKFEEGRTQTMDLYDVDPHVFGILVDWIYSQEVTDFKKERSYLVTCAKLWILGDRFLMRKLQNDASRQIHARLMSVKGLKKEEAGFGEFCRIVAELENKDNPLLRMAIRLMSSSKKVFDRWVDEAPRSILLSASKNLRLCADELEIYAYPAPEPARWDPKAEKFFVEDQEDGKA
jgi:hypothetical protein